MILLSIIAGTFIAFFFPVVIQSFDQEFVESEKGTLTLYSGVFLMAIGIVITK
jgi:ABC-type Mn2+/Zn2+ transport system permease subunit